MREALEKYLEITQPKAASAFEYASADDSGSSNRRAHRAAVIDTGPLYALFDSKDRWHKKTHAWLGSNVVG